MTDISTYMRQARSRRGVDPRQWAHDRTWDESREWIDALSDHVGDWQGIPVPLGEDTPIVLAEGHPLRGLYAELRQASMVDLDVIVTSGDVPDDEEILRYWFCRKRNVGVYVARSKGRYYAITVPISPDRSMDRLTMWLQTMGAADAWDLKAEHAARDTLRAMLTERQWMHYDLTGSFFETSQRSRVTYVFRRLRPTIAMSPRGKDGREDMMRCLAVLCLHPIGYYAKSWAGCMVPSDDVIAHLAHIRADESYFWRKANQHAPSSPEAGL